MTTTDMDTGTSMDINTGISTEVINMVILLIKGLTLNDVTS